MRPGKLYALQVVRALAAILVVWVHANDVTKTLGIPVFVRSLGALQKFGACGVDLFFVLSGFVVSLSAARPQNPGGFIGRRFVRIYPLCWIVLALFVGTNLGMFAPGFPLGHAQVAGRLAYSALLLPSPPRVKRRVPRGCRIRGRWSTRCSSTCASTWVCDLDGGTRGSSRWSPSSGW